MSAASPLDQWRFVIGKWKGVAKDEFGEKGVTESTHVFSAEPSDKFIMGKHEARNQGRLVNKSISLLFYDPTERRLKRRTFFSYGFVNIETEFARTAKSVKFDIHVEPTPKQFEGIRWRSYIERLSENEMAMGLEMAKGNEEFRNYGRTLMTRTN